MVIIYGIVEDVNDYGYIDVETTSCLDYLLWRDKCEWFVPGTTSLEDSYEIVCCGRWMGL